MGCINQKSFDRKQQIQNDQQSKHLQPRERSQIHQKPNQQAQQPQPHQIRLNSPQNTHPRNVSQIRIEFYNGEERERLRGQINPRSSAIIHQNNEQISQTLSQLQRRRDNPEEQSQSVEEIHNVSRFQLLFILFQTLRTQDMDERQNLILFLRLLDLLSSQPEAQGLNQQQINSLQRRVATNNGQSCAVCQEQLKNNQQIVILPCKHFYHPECINPWLSKSDKCPMCRSSARRNN